MANIFEKYAADREAEQKKIEKAVVADTTADGERQEWAQADGERAGDHDCCNHP